MKKCTSRRLERFRSSKNVQKVTEKQGCGKKLAREAKALNIKAELQKQKVSGKAVTELAYTTPRFVEDFVRELALAMEHENRITWYMVSVASHESIHNHDAFASVERSKI